MKLFEKFDVQSKAPIHLLKRYCFYFKQETPFGEVTTQLGCVTSALDFSDDSIQMLEADVVFGTVIVSYPAKTGTGFKVE